QARPALRHALTQAPHQPRTPTAKPQVSSIFVRPLDIGASRKARRRHTATPGRKLLATGFGLGVSAGLWPNWTRSGYAPTISL
ncbi:MAG TPA: hypothetical protein VF070_25010, partial [Streptosporangiaceae bacterium]